MQAVARGVARWLRHRPAIMMLRDDYRVDLGYAGIYDAGSLRRATRRELRGVPVLMPERLYAGSRREAAA